MFKLNAKFDADSLLYSLSHFECHSHMLHMPTQQHLPPPLASTVKSLFTHVCSNPLSLAARLHQFRTNHSNYINNGWIFFLDRPHVLDLWAMWGSRAPIPCTIKNSYINLAPPKTLVVPQYLSWIGFKTHTHPHHRYQNPWMFKCPM